MGVIFKVPAAIIYILGGIWGLIICLGIVSSKLGTLGIIVSLFVFPATLYLAPWYVGFADNNWFPVLVVYGSGIGAAVLFQIGALLDGNK
jgi:hypothetical protein